MLNYYAFEFSVIIVVFLNFSVIVKKVPCQTLEFQKTFLAVLHNPAEGAVCHPEKPQSSIYLSIGL